MKMTFRGLASDKPLAFALAGAALLAACETAQQASAPEAASPRASAVEETISPRVTPVAEELAALGLDTQVPTPLAEVEALLGVEQISRAGSGGDSYAFETVEGDHPCIRDGQIDSACSARAAELDRRVAGTMGRSRRANPESSLQSITPDVIDPDTFDPVLTADEIGRTGRLQSQAAQSLGSSLLGTGHLPPTDEPDPADPAEPELPTGPLPPDWLIRTIPPVQSN